MAAKRDTGHSRPPLKAWLLDLVANEPDLTLDEIRDRLRKLRHLPACSPDINPTENLDAQAESGLRKAAARIAEALHGAVGKTLASVAPEECASYFRHAGYRS